MVAAAATAGAIGRHRFEGRALGSALGLTLVGADPEQAAAAWDAVVAEMAEVDRRLSRFRADSELSRLNVAAGRGGWTDVSRNTSALLTTAWRAQRLTGGRFDARVVEALEAIGEQAGVPLPSVARRHTPAAVEPPWLARDGRTRRLRVNAPIDSGGLGKGLALRWALQAARRAAPTADGLLLEAGGDLVVGGGGPDDDAWSIGIEDPGGGARPLAVVRVRDAAVATSSTAVRRWLDDTGRTVHHLIDPRSGEPADTGLVAVTVALGDPAWAEVWTKALFLAGAAQIGPEARSRGLAAWWVETDGSLHLTPAARHLTTWVAAEGTQG